MAEIHSIRDGLTTHDIVCSRIAEAKAITTILAMATSPDADPPAFELVSRALDGVTALLADADNAMTDIQIERAHVNDMVYQEAKTALCGVGADRGRRTVIALLNKYGADHLCSVAPEQLPGFIAECNELRAGG
jgi:hypothetical protein